MFTTKNLFMLLGRHLLIAGGFVLIAVIIVVFAMVLYRVLNRWVEVSK